VISALSAAEFERFNDRYLSQLAGWGLVPAAGSPPPARTNVAPAGTELTEPAVAGFSYTRPYTRPSAQQPPTSSCFVISGVPELREHFSYPGDIVRHGETSPDALADKARCVIDVIAARIKELGLDGTESARVHLYSVHDMAGVVGEQLLTRVGVAPLYGITWHHAAPPIDELELEIDVRRYTAEPTRAPPTDCKSPPPAHAAVGNSDRHVPHSEF
jgi:hypothetical protein